MSPKKRKSVSEKPPGVPPSKKVKEEIIKTEVSDSENVSTPIKDETLVVKADPETPVVKTEEAQTETSPNKDDSSPKDDQSTESSKKKKSRNSRKRMKKVYTDLLTQMEFYFSDANISKSKFMQEALKESEWLNLSTFMNFNKLASLLMASFGKVEASDLYKALSTLPSDLLEVRQTANSMDIRRKTPFVSRTPAEVDQCTIYVENLPTSSTLESVTSIFKKFGNVLYISLPKFKVTQVVKGFAFVEFDLPASAMKALEAFSVGKNFLVPVNPADLSSVKTYIIEKEQEKQSGPKGRGKAGSETKSPKEIKNGDVKDEEVKNEKSKESEQVKGEDKTAEAKESETAGSEGTKEDENANGESANEEMEDVEMKEKKRNRSKRQKKKDEQNTSAVTTEAVIDPKALHVLSKVEWKKLRNKYLNLQRKNMGQAKLMLRQHFTSQQPEIEKESPPPKPVVPDALMFEPRVVVHFTLEEPIDDVAVLKKRIKAAAMESVKYIDARTGANSYYVRCGNADQAKTLANVKILGCGKILADDDEKNYWAKAQKDREDKLSGKVDKKSNRPRGKDRIVQRLRKLEEKPTNNHKFFDDDD